MFFETTDFHATFEGDIALHRFHFNCHNLLSFLVLVFVIICFNSHCAFGPLHDAKILSSAPSRQEGFALATDTLTISANNS